LAAILKETKEQKLKKVKEAAEMALKSTIKEGEEDELNLEIKGDSDKKNCLIIEPDSYFRNYWDIIQTM
jgi:hypothetical protein